MSESKQKKQFRLTCMFCGEPGSSREHYIPSWSHKYFEHLPNRIRPLTLETLYDRPNRTMTVDESERETGRARHKDPVLQVCEDCNNKWMGEIVNAAKPGLERWAFPSGLARSGRVPKDEIEAISKWVVLAAITYQVPRSIHSILPQDIAHMHQAHEIPANWRVAIAPVNVGADHHALISEHGLSGRTPYGRKYSVGASTFLIVLVDCLLLVWRTTATGPAGQLWENRKLHDFYPVHEGRVPWETMEPLTGDEIYRLIANLRLFADRIFEAQMDHVILNARTTPRRGH